MITLDANRSALLSVGLDSSAESHLGNNLTGKIVASSMEDNCSLMRHNSSQFPSSDYICNLYDFIIEAVLMGLLCAFGFVGNILSSICLWKDKSKSATPFLLVSLELFDTFFIITVFFLRVLTSIDTYSPDLLPGLYDLVPYVGKYVYPCALIAETGTIYVTLLVTVNRYIAVCRPYEASNLGSVANARIHVVIVTIFAIVFNIPRFFEYDVVDVPAFSGDCEQAEMLDNVTSYYRRAYSSWLLNDFAYQIVYSNALYFFAMFLFPLISLVFLNYRLMTTLQRTRRKRETLRRRSDASTGSNSRSEDDITMMLIVVVLIFVVTQAPALITQFLGSIQLHRHGEAYLTCPNMYFFYARISDLLVVLNSSINFVVYCLCSRRFRQILMTIICSSSSGMSSGGRRRSSESTAGGTVGGGTTGAAGDSTRRKTNLSSRLLVVNGNHAGEESAVVSSYVRYSGLDGVGQTQQQSADLKEQDTKVVVAPAGGVVVNVSDKLTDESPLIKVNGINLMVELVEGREVTV